MSLRTGERDGRMKTIWKFIVLGFMADPWVTIAVNSVASIWLAFSGYRPVISFSFVILGLYGVLYRPQIPSPEKDVVAVETKRPSCVECGNIFCDHPLYMREESISWLSVGGMTFYGSEIPSDRI